MVGLAVFEIRKITGGSAIFLVEAASGSGEISYLDALSSQVHRPYVALVGSGLRSLEDLRGIEVYLSRSDVMRSATAIYALPGGDSSLAREMSGLIPEEGGVEALLKLNAPMILCVGLSSDELGAVRAMTVAGDHVGLRLKLGADDPGSWKRKPAISAVLRDIHSERTFLSYRADVCHRPASITKLLTIWLVREKMIAEGVGFSERVEISESAVKVPGFWGMQAGESASFRDLIRAAAIISCNEAANALAEWHGGDLSDFPKKLNRIAREWGLYGSRFSSASGLGLNQVTNAVDVGRLVSKFVLGRRDVMPFFRERSFSWNGLERAATNRLLRKIPGATGLKTGTLKNYGFNLTFTAKRGDGHVAAVVLGAASRASRDRITRVLLDTI